MRFFYIFKTTSFLLGGDGGVCGHVSDSFGSLADWVRGHVSCTLFFGDGGVSGHVGDCFGSLANWVRWHVSGVYLSFFKVLSLNSGDGGLVNLRSLSGVSFGGSVNGSI